MRVKICGITKADQGCAIAEKGATALGFICVPQSPRYIQPGQIGTIVEQLPREVDKIGVFVNAKPAEITKIVAEANLTGVQLHGDESPEFCQQLRQVIPQVEIIKALRVRTTESLSVANSYIDFIDTLLLDAYHPGLLGGTGKTLDWQTLAFFQPNKPWLLAGGLTPDNVSDALDRVHPSGIDLSSGVERSPGDKDLDKVAQLFLKLHLDL